MDWDINDATIPNNVNRYDSFQDWPDDHIRLVYPINCEPARRHASGWAMRNTNNHNVHILKKSCLGVLMCSQRCKLNNTGQELRLRPAICDKARKKQLGKGCPNPKCSGGGTLVLIPCKGNSGFPCTHFWRHTNNAIFFQAKGVHDHPQPELKTNNLEVRKTITKMNAASSTGRQKVLRKKKGSSRRSHNHPQLPVNPNQSTPISYTIPESHNIDTDIKPNIIISPDYHQSIQYHNQNDLQTQSQPQQLHHQTQLQHQSNLQHLEPQLCPGCSQYYCICYLNTNQHTTTNNHHHPHQNPQHQDYLNNGYHQQESTSSFNNNQETFKPSDIFNFEVSNYYPSSSSSYYETTTTQLQQQQLQPNQYYEYWNSNNNWN